MCTVNGSSTVGGVNVSPATTVTVALSDLAGVKTWALSIVGTDELVSAPALSINSVTKTATFTAPASGSALILKSVVNGGLDVNGNVDASLSTTFGVYTLSVYGTRVLAAGETLEGHQTHGWVKQINTAIRAGSGTYAPNSSSFVTTSTDGLLTNERVLTGGSGISITDGGSTVTVAVVDGSITNAKLAADAVNGVNIVAGAITSAKIADATIVNNDINAGAAIAGTKITPAFGAQNISTTGTCSTGGLSCTTLSVSSNAQFLSSSQVIFLSGCVASWQGTGSTVNGAGTTYQKSVTTTDATVTTCSTIPVQNSAIFDVIVTVVAIKSDETAHFKQDVEACFRVNNAGAVTEIGSNTASTAKTNGTTTGMSVVIDSSAPNLRVRVTGRAAETWQWTVNITYVWRTV